MTERRIYYINISDDEIKKYQNSLSVTSGDTSSTTRTVTHTKFPSMWRVVLHNDDFTPYSFVVQLIQLVFHKTLDEASVLADRVHHRGAAEIGLFTKEIAITKTSIVIATAEQYGYPLMAEAFEA